MAYLDQDITFIMHISHETEKQLTWCLFNLRKTYPLSRVVVVSDGVHAHWHISSCAEYKAEYVAGMKLYGVESGCRIWIRLFEKFFEKPTRYLFRIDPDTYIKRRFDVLPESGVFGSVSKRHKLIQGGCIGMTIDYVHNVMSFDKLHNGYYDDYNNWAFNKVGRCRAEIQKLTSMDMILCDINKKLSIEPIDHREINSVWQKEQSLDGEFSVIHPIVVSRKWPLWKQERDRRLKAYDCGWLPQVIKYWKPKSLLDLGCSCGLYLDLAKECGVDDVFGVDNTDGISTFSDNIMEADLVDPILLEHKYDVTLCVEVLEHIHALYEDDVISNIVRYSDRIIFSASSTFDGDGHINVRPQQYWIDKITKHDFKQDVNLTSIIRNHANKKWFRTNLLAFYR